MKSYKNYLLLIRRWSCCKPFSTFEIVSKRFITHFHASWGFHQSLYGLLRYYTHEHWLLWSWRWSGLEMTGCSLFFSFFHSFYRSMIYQDSYSKGMTGPELGCFRGIFCLRLHWLFSLICCWYLSFLSMYTFSIFRGYRNIFRKQKRMSS